MKYMKIEIRDQHGNLLNSPDYYPCVDTLLIVVELPESDAEQRRAADLAAIELLRRIKEDDAENISIILSKELSNEIDAILKTAAGS